VAQEFRVSENIYIVTHLEYQTVSQFYTGRSKKAFKVTKF